MNQPEAVENTSDGRDTPSSLKQFDPHRTSQQMPDPLSDSWLVRALGGVLRLYFMLVRR